MNKDLDFDDVYKFEDNRLIDTTTGEVIPISKIEKTITKNIIETFQEKQKTLNELGIDNKLRLIRAKTGQEFWCTEIKQGYTFNKVFRVEVRNMFKANKLSIYAKGFIANMEPFLYFPTNTIVIDGKNPDMNKLCEMLEVKQAKMYRVLKELEDNEIIKRVKINGNMIIFFNPFLYSCGGIVDLETYKLFEKSIYNPICK
ncbi:MAG: hypothetical protein PHY30_03635 [Candidatus Pacebacteria bacterium]|nr:hypothetical protein [Candidatus Paceibacterota bacterium]